MKAFEYTGRKDSDPDKLDVNGGGNTTSLRATMPSAITPSQGTHRPQNEAGDASINEGGDASMAEVLL
jgi:hypothetical protein